MNILTVLQCIHFLSVPMNMVQTSLEETPEPEQVSAFDLFNTIPPSSHLKVSVILPVRNELENLPKTLDALRKQYNKAGKHIPYAHYEVLLLANNCTDASASFAREYKKRYPDFSLHIEEISLSGSVAHIGTVRRLLMDAAYNRFAMLAMPGGIIASTDGDTEVDRNWIFNTIEEIKRGNDVVGGRILTRPETSVARVYYLRDVSYKHLVSRIETIIDPIENDPWPRHYQCFGASFAVTCAIYDRSGRLPVVPFLEDMAFHKALKCIDARIRLSPLVKVFTSTRIQGRVDFGFSIQLKQWGEMNEANDPVLVESANGLVKKLTARRHLRQYWLLDQDQRRHSHHLWQAGEILQIDAQWLLDRASETGFFGMFWEKIEEELTTGMWSQNWPKMDVVDVIPQLKAKILEFEKG